MEMNDADIERDIVGTYMMYKGQLVYVVSLDDDKLYTRNMLTHVKKPYKFNLEDFRPITGRVGLVNCGGYVVSVTRVPYRKMFIGMNWRNCSIEVVHSNDIRNTEEYNNFKYHLGTYLHDAVSNNYPRFSKALELAQETAGGYAFDKQFFVTNTGLIGYKTQGFVGKLIKGAKTEAGIVLEERFQHLQPLLDSNYEKTVRTFRS